MKTRVKEFRLQKGMTQQQLAKMVHVSNRTIKVKIRLPKLLQISGYTLH